MEGAIAIGAIWSNASPLSQLALAVQQSESRRMKLRLTDE